MYVYLKLLCDTIVHVQVSIIQRQKARRLLNIDQVRSTVDRALTLHSNGGRGRGRGVFSTLFFGTLTQPPHPLTPRDRHPCCLPCSSLQRT